MSRKSDIYNFLENSYYNPATPNSYTTVEISSTLGLLRNNVSYELNMLVKEGSVEKSDTRPVLYSIRKPQDIDPFKDLIGSDGSLSEQVLQAKSAMLYPINGLHSLLTGSTGVGKTHFARLMHRFACVVKNKPTMPFVVFNCADYSNNPELLVSHLFGHVKGAFTGAISDKAGVIEAANNGILFIDEIHRLPPAGQEMVFFFLDCGKFGKLGEATRDRQAEVTLICATTTEQSSSLLKTFHRRIPFQITIPNIETRSAQEQIDLFHYFARKEAEHIKREIFFECDAIKSILGFSFKGNVGKLKSTIQMVCARSLLDFENETNKLSITYSKLPIEVKGGLFDLGRDSQYLHELNNISWNGLQVLIETRPDSNTQVSVESDITMETVLRSFNDKAQAILKKEITHLDKRLLLEQELTTFTLNQNPNLQCYNNEQLDIARKIIDYISLFLNQKPNLGAEKIIYAFVCNHVSADQHKIEYNQHIRGFVDDFYPADDKSEKLMSFISQVIEKECQLFFSSTERNFLSFIVSSFWTTNSAPHIIVICHGDSIASSMKSVAQSLVGGDNIHAIDMPLDVSPQKVLDELTSYIKGPNLKKDILLLVDMGSTCFFDKILHDTLNKKTKLVDMVSTPVVIEALRLSQLPNENIDSIHLKLQTFTGYNSFMASTEKLKSNKDAIVVIKSDRDLMSSHVVGFINDLLVEFDFSCDVLELKSSELEQLETEIAIKYNVLFATGLQKPNNQWAFISLNELFTLDGEEFILSRCNIKPSIIKKEHNYSITLQKLAECYLQSYLVVLNPKSIVSLTIKFIESINTKRKLKVEHSNILRQCIHICIALDRTQRKDTVDFSQHEFNIPAHVFKLYQMMSTLVFEE